MMDKEQVLKFRESAIADGWSYEPTYPRNEDKESASSHEKEGWKMMCLIHWLEKAERWSTNVTIWAPDGLQIVVPETYDWDEIQARTMMCSKCGKADVATERYSFAGRCCADCRPEMARKYEYPGWTK